MKVPDDLFMLSHTLRHIQTRFPIRQQKLISEPFKDTPIDIENELQSCVRCAGCPDNLLRDFNVSAMWLSSSSNSLGRVQQFIRYDREATR